MGIPLLLRYHWAFGTRIPSTVPLAHQANKSFVIISSVDLNRINWKIFSLIHSVSISSPAGLFFPVLPFFGSHILVVYGHFLCPFPYALSLTKSSIGTVSKAEMWGGGGPGRGDNSFIFQWLAFPRIIVLFFPGVGDVLKSVRYSQLLTKKLLVDGIAFPVVGRKINSSRMQWNAASAFYSQLTTEKGMILGNVVVYMHLVM